MIDWCEACQRRHHKLMVCAPRVVHKPSMVVHKVVHAPVVVHGGGSQATAMVVHASRHGRHLDTEARRAYRREWMRAQRARARTL